MIKGMTEPALLHASDHLFVFKFKNRETVQTTSRNRFVVKRDFSSQMKYVINFANTF